MAKLQWDMREHAGQLSYVARWLTLGLPLGGIVGSVCALFLWSLERVTELRFELPWLLYLLPVAGILVVWMYHLAGKDAERGNNLLIEEIHQPGGGVPARMGPLVLIGTVITHLCGGSAGREGTAVQMGGSIAAAVSRALRINRADTTVLLMAGVSAGFGAVFGTPLAGTVFAMEVLAIGQLNYRAVVPCLIAALSADWVCTAWGIHHTAYKIAGMEIAGHASPLQLDLLIKAACAGMLFGLASVLFVWTTHGVQEFCRRWINIFWLRPVCGAMAVIGLTFLFGRDYLGLGVTSPDAHAVTIVSAFQPNGANDWSFLLKILFTALTIGSGFKGGEVTPLFFIGATLGNLVSKIFHAPTDLFAGLGFVAVFAGAANTPLACIVMGLELFGSGPIVYITIACYTAYLFSGHQGIYHAQRIAIRKGDSLTASL